MKEPEISIDVVVASPLEGTQCALSLIIELLKKNNIDMDLTMVYDYCCEEMGFYLNNDEMRGTIFVNPLICKVSGSEDDDEDSGYPGYVADQSIFGVTIHEFSHLLQFEIYEDIIDEYAQEFPTQRLYLNEYSNNEFHDELAEIMSLYITNPYLLKLISKEHWKFCKKYFKSPIPCSLNKCYQIYKSFPIKIKEQLKDKWKIVYNEHLDNFEKVIDGKTKKITK